MLSLTPSFRSLILAAIGAALSLTGIKAQSTSVNWSNTTTPLLDFSGVALSAGLTPADGDGDVLQLGYFDQNNGAGFLGNFVPITGQGSLNLAEATTSIGDDGGGDTGPLGFFSIDSAFGPGAAPSSIGRKRRDSSVRVSRQTFVAIL